ncbi:Nif11-like leader peptide family natural product precursor [Synechococcus sp. AH-601-O06]|nr:Nif11-like leader peptide family natural product precursor [Synechococcus sp. AH-601-O06]
MSEEQLKAFLEKVQGDTSLQEKLKAAADADAVAAIAREAGFSISTDDLTKAQSELSEEELEGVAGGILGRNCGLLQLDNKGYILQLTHK